MGLGADVRLVKQSKSTNWWPLEGKTKQALSRLHSE
jgi:hypothetical protein